LHVLRSRSRRIIAAAAISVFVAAVAGALVSPASAGGVQFSTAASSAFCSTDYGVFDGLSGLTAGSTARSGKTTVRDRNTRGIVSDSEFSGPKPSTAGFSATIPVYFHVITDGSTGHLSRSTVRDQIDVLNLSFGGFYGRVDTGFRFTLAGLDFTSNAEWFAQETFAAEVAMKSALKQGDATALNIYSTSGGGFLGWAYYPKIVTSNEYQVLDGVVIHYGSVPGGPIEGFNLGYTATHEAGHWLGLAHTFEQGCQGARRLRRRHPGGGHADEWLSRRQGHLHGAGGGSDPQLHGLLGRPLLQPVHGGAGDADAGAVPALARGARLLKRNSRFVYDGPATAGPSCAQAW
jgi:hypothetical protein